LVSLLTRHEMNITMSIFVGSTLKPNIVNAGKDCAESYTVEEIGEANIRVLRDVFLWRCQGRIF
jgi:fructose-bisphosphate aldolase class 1